MPIGPHLRVDTGEVSGHRLISLVGDVDLASCSIAEDAMQGLSGSSVVLDLRKVDFIDSTGLKLLVTQQSEFDDHGGSLVLVVEDDTIVRRLLDMTRLAEAFRIARSLGELD